MAGEKERGYAKTLVDSTPPQRNMKSIDLLFTSDSFERSACDVSVANLQSQYTFLSITRTCKEKGKREKRFLSYRTESSVPLCALCHRGQTACFVYYLKDLMQWKEGDKGDEGEMDGEGDGERLEPERGSLWQSGVRKKRACQGRDPMSCAHVHMRVAFQVCKISQTSEKHTQCTSCRPWNICREQKKRQFQISSFKSSDSGKSMRSKRNWQMHLKVQILCKRILLQRETYREKHTWETPHC